MKRTERILVVDDEEDILITLRFFLKQHFESVQTEHNPNLLPRHLRNGEFDLVLLDMNFRKGDTSGQEGLAWLEKIKTLDPTISVIMITAHGEVEMAVEAVKKGAIDFVVKPWRNEKLLASISAALRLRESVQEVQQLQSKKAVLQSEIDQQYSKIIGESEQMQQIFNTIQKVAATDANILLLGENGTGKELIARAIHRQSPRHQEVFISVDLGAIPDSLFESELFGHKKGSFTDAHEDRVGRFEVASDGTLFLDEIGNLSLPLQAKLLTALQTRQIRKLGSNQLQQINIRLICATNMPLYEMIKDSSFRQDLLYRINTVEITLPPLRDRKDDIPLLADHFLKIYAPKYQKPKLKLAKGTLQKLSEYHWPGNIRELRHSVERAVILCETDALLPSDFLFHEKAADSSTALSTDNLNLEEMERWTVKQAIQKHQGNITKAAKELGLTRAALYRRMEKYGF